MAHGITGKAATALVAGSAIAGKLLGWEHHYTGEQVDDTGAGDTWRGKVATFVAWEATIEVEITSPYTSQYALLNAASAISLKVQSGDSTPYFAATGICSDIMAPVRFDQIVTQKFTFIGDGSAPGTP
jgi:hypothetical protein